MIFVSSLEFQVGFSLYVTAAVQAGLTPQRGQSDRSTFRFIGTCWNLSFSVDPLPLPAMFPFSSLPSERKERKKERERERKGEERKVFPATNNRPGTHPRKRGVILSIAFRKTPESKERKGSPSSLGVPGCFVIAGSPSFRCVPGRMCRSWEHLCLLLSSPLFSSSSCPLFPRARRVYKQTRLLRQVFLMRFGLSSVCPRSFGSPLIGPPQTVFFPLFFHVFLSSCLFILILSFSCAHHRPDLSLYTYTHAYYTYSEVQVAQVRYNEVWLIGCPSSLGSFSSATTHTFVCLVLLIFICPFACACAYLLSGQDGGHTCLPSGRRVCVTLGVIGILLDLLSFS